MKPRRGHFDLNAAACALAFAFVSILTVAAFAIPLEGSADPKLPQNCHWLPGPHAVRNMPVEVLDPNPQSVRLLFTQPPIEIGTITLNSKDFETVRLTGEAATIEYGAPEVPKVARLIMIGNTGNVKLNIRKSSYHVELLKGDIAPAQYMDGDEGAPADGYTPPIAEIYGSNSWYPARVAEITDPATLRDVRFVSVIVHPVQVNPTTREIRVYDEIEIEVVNTGGVGPNEIHMTPTSIDPSFKKLYSEFENFHGSSLDELPEVPGQYLVLCRDYVTIREKAQQLVNWHKRKGLDASYQALTSGQLSADAIRTLIHNRYNSSGGKLAYVCIIGDPSTGTADSLEVTTHSTQYDNYFGNGVTSPTPPDNPDPIPDIAVGRLSPTDTTQLNAVIQKSIKYETEPYVGDTGWFTRTWCAAHTAYAPSNPSFKRYTEAIMLQHGITSVYWDQFYHALTAADVTVLNNRLTSGISVFNHRMSYINEMYPSDLNDIPVNSMWPFVMSMTCNTGTFTGNSLSEAWLMPNEQSFATLKGAIGCVGFCGSGTHTRYNNSLDAGAMYGLYVQEITEQALILIAGKLQLYRNYYDDDPTNVANFCYWGNLMGDPAVPIWKKRPRTATVAAPTSVNIGTNHIRVEVRNSSNNNPAEGALVCLWKNGESYSRGFCDENGRIDLPCTTATAGTIKLTVTKDDLIAHQADITVASSTAWLALDSVAVDDDNIGSTSGDNNDYISPGETVEISLRLRNAGTSSTITGITSTLACSSPGIQILSFASAFPNIAVGARATQTTPFRFAVTSVFNGEPVSFYLYLSSSAGAETLRVDLTPRAPDVDYIWRRYTASGGSLTAGTDGDLIVTFRNTGLKGLSGAQGILRSLDPFIVVTDSLGSFGDVAAGVRDSNDTNPFHINISAGAFPGHRAVMEMVITDATGFRDSTLFDSTNFFATDPGLLNRDSSNFILTIGTRDTASPSGPDAYGYYAYDNSETNPGLSASTYDWIEISPRLGGSGTSMNFNDHAEDQDSSRTITLPFTFRFYGEDFTQITVCSNGWIAFGSYLIDDARNYRMGTPPGPPNQVAAYWDDLHTFGLDSNCYYYHDATNHRFIIEWRSRLAWESQASNPTTGITEIFQIILYDPVYFPSLTGDGKIKVQYHTAAVLDNHESATNDYSTIGIQNADHSTGLDYYYWNTYSSGSSPVRAGRAIMYTTDATGQMNPTIQVGEPNGGENWFVGQNYNIIWYSTAVQGNVNIEIKRNYPSGTWETLFSNTPNDGVQPWLVTSPASAGTARIRVTSVSNPSIADTSDAGFSITMPTVTLISPNGGEVLITGSQTYIDWNEVGLGSAKIEINRNYPAGAWEVLRAAEPQGFLWTVSGAPSLNARIRVSGNALPSITDISDASFTIGIAPVIQHDPHADQNLGTALFVANITDDASGFDAKVHYRPVGGASFDSLSMTATINPNEFYAVTPSLPEGTYEYFIRARDAQGFSATVPDSTTYSFDVGFLTTSWVSYDDGTAENYNWVDGPDYQWAVRFDMPAYPYALCGARFAVCPTVPSDAHQPIQFRVLLADGPGGMPGTVVYSDTTACASNVIGGLPAGAAWADIITRSGGQALQLSGPFYLSVQNPEVRIHPVAFAHDTTGTRNHKSYLYDACEAEWYSEDAAFENARPGNRMIRANGFSLAPLQVVIQRSDSAGVSSAMLRWTSNGAPYYRIYSATTAQGPFTTLEGTIAGPASGLPVQFRDLNAIGESVRRYYQVHSSDQP